jgi:hypothetical protein
VASQFKDLTTEEIERSVRAIQIRNRAVHEGDEPPATLENINTILGLMRTIGKIIGKGEIRFPRLVGRCTSIANADS